MAINGFIPYGTNTQSCCAQQQCCPDPFGCPCGRCPDFEVRRHDTKPPYRVSVSDCNGPLDLMGTIAEVSMWAIGKFKKAVAPTDTYFALADDVGFQQANVGDVIVVDRVRNPEQMIIQGFDEVNKLIEVKRGHNGTQPGTYRKGCKIRIFRVLNGVAETVTIREDIPNVDGSVDFGVVTDSQLVYHWLPNDTCLPGCFWLEFKLLKMVPPSSLTFWPDIVPLQFCSVSVVSCISIIPSIIPSFVPSVTGCDLGSGVEWVRRFPLTGEGFLIRINESFTAENVT